MLLPVMALAQTNVEKNSVTLRGGYSSWNGLNGTSLSVQYCRHLNNHFGIVGEVSSLNGVEKCVDPWLRESFYGTALTAGGHFHALLYGKLRIGADISAGALFYTTTYAYIIPNGVPDVTQDRWWWLAHCNVDLTYQVAEKVGIGITVGRSLLKPLKEVETFGSLGLGVILAL